MRLRLAFLLTLVLALAAPSAASALTLKINNESGRSPDDVYVTVYGTADYNVPGMENDVPRKLSEVPDPLTINSIVSGRVYVSFGAPVTVHETFNSLTRFDWAELTVTPSASDVANLTAVDQFAIGMRLETFNAAGGMLEALSASNSDTIFNALQGIPGGPESTIRNGGEIVRVLSPVHSTAYPDLGEYVRSMSGKEITLHTGLFFEPFATSEYSGTFQADGSIELTGTTDPGGHAESPININGPELIEDIYTGANTPNTGAGAIRRDVLAAFSAGFWGGRYGNDAIGFCTNPATSATLTGTWCPNGFNQPAYAAARTAVAPYPTYEEYAAVIDRYANEYGNPYSDASSRVTVGLDQPVTGGAVDSLCLTILPDSGGSGPGASSGNANCGATSGGTSSGGTSSGGSPAPTATPTATGATPAVRFRIAKKARLRGAKLRVGKLVCAGSCGQVRAIARKGHKVIASAKLKVRAKQRLLVLKLTKVGRRILAHKSKLKVQLVVSVTPPGEKTIRARRLVLVLHGHQAARKGHAHSRR
jgi:hypothetical protein